jgi:uncharacterized membrane protein YoaK (UPF0700 family)
MGGIGGAAGAMSPPPARSSAVLAASDLLLVGLTFAAGVVDAVSYLGLGGIFTANMTGNLVFLALAVGERSLLTALHSVAALLGFCAGAILTGWVLPRTRPKGPWPPQVTWLLFGEFACLLAFALGWAAVGGNPAGTSAYLLIVLSSFGMGLQNAAARYLAVPGLTTTVITMGLTGFMVDLPALGVSGTTQRRAALAVIALFSGAAIGGALMVYDRTLTPFLTIATVLSVAAFALVLYRGRTRAAQQDPPDGSTAGH